MFELLPLALQFASMMGKQGGSGGGSPAGSTGGASPAGGGMGGSMPGKGSALSLVTGLVQSAQAHSLKKQADSAMPPLVDPSQAGFLSELNQKRKSIETGADFASGMNALNSSNAGTNDAIIRNSGGDVGGTMQALLGSQRATQDAKNNLLAQGANEQMGYNSLYGEFLNKVAARKMQLQLQKSAQSRAEWASKQNSAQANLNAGIAGMTGGQSNLAGNSGDQSASPAGSGGGQDFSQIFQKMLGGSAGMGGAGMTELPTGAAMGAGMV